ncbi:MAG: type VI secretion system contractile sheath large subunit [Myxococcales bacterium]|nr:type VI secretion system contractile sheath large subunit [Myxococcales bacterium]
MKRHEIISLCVLADFAGSACKPLAERRFVRVDRDTLDDAIRSIRPVALLQLPFCRSLRISSFDDFRPDQIAERVPALKALLYARAEVANPAAMRVHLEEAGASQEIETNSPNSADIPATSTEPVADEDLLESILTPSTAPTRNSSSSLSSFDNLVRAIVEESAARNDFAREDTRRAAIDDELGRRIRAILHHPKFQSLEASWCAVREIVRAGKDIPLNLFDLRLDETVEDAEQPDRRDTLVERMGWRADPGLLATRFSHMLCAMEINDDDQGQLACSHLSVLAAECSATLLIGVKPALMRDGGLPSPIWRQQLTQSASNNVMLAHPQILLRLPYGEETDPIDEFRFEELDEEAEARLEPERSRYLWGSAALALGIALSSWDARGGGFGEITSLPIHVFRSQDKIRSIGPVAELLSEARIKELNDAGFVCLVGIVGGDSARVVGMRSLLG